MRNDLLKKASASIYLPDYLTEQNNEVIAKELITQIDQVWKIFQFEWLEDNGLSAKKTLEERAGKCVNFSNLAVALCRNLKIPSGTISGYCDTGTEEGHHAWARSYFYPYGWVKFDPTNNQFTDFEHDAHAYEIFRRSDDENFPELTIIEKDQSYPPCLLHKIQRLLEDDKTISDRILHKKPHTTELQFLQSLSVK